MTVVRRLYLTSSLVVLGAFGCDRSEPLEPSICGSGPCFTASAKPGKPTNPTNLRIVSGNNQTDTANTALTADYVVQVTDRNGNGVPGVVIDWAVTSGGGSVTPVQTTTVAPLGHARTRHTLGSAAGPQTVIATAKALPGTAVTFTATAFALGALEVTNRTTGTDFDANGYDVLGRTISANGALTIPLLAGNYVVALSRVSMNCSVTSPSPMTVAVSSGATTAVAFEVACLPATELAFDAAGIQVVKSNHGVASVLATGPGPNSEPAWSPDGNKIAFRSERDGNAEIYVMNRDGTNLARLTEHPAADYEPAWSPDGARVAFVSERDGNRHIYAMNADGTNVVRLTTDVDADGHPAWSPDGAGIAFTRGGSCYAPWSWYVGDNWLSGRIHVMRTDGSQVTPLTECGTAEEGWTSDAHPAWSPDGTRIAFMRWTCVDSYCDPYEGEPENEIFVMNADGSGVKWFASSGFGGVGDGGGPTWSPDGYWIGFAGGGCDFEHGCGYGLGAVKSDGTPVYALLLELNYLPKNASWRP